MDYRIAQIHSLGSLKEKLQDAMFLNKDAFPLFAFLMEQVTSEGFQLPQSLVEGILVYLDKDFVDQYIVSDAFRAEALYLSELVAMAEPEIFGGRR